MAGAAGVALLQPDAVGDADVDDMRLVELEAPMARAGPHPMRPRIGRASAEKAARLAPSSWSQAKQNSFVCIPHQYEPNLTYPRGLCLLRRSW